MDLNFQNSQFPKFTIYGCERVSLYTAKMPNNISSHSYSVLTAVFQMDLGCPVPVERLQILDFTGDKDDGGGGDNWSYKTCKAPNRRHQKVTYYTQ